MKKILYTLIFAAVAFISCKKEETELTPLASLNVVNAIVGGKNVKLNTNVVDSAAVNSGKIFSLVVGNSKVVIYPSGNVVTPYYSNNIATQANDCYSLYLTGSPTTVESILVKDNIPFHTDSVFTIRVVNLSPNSTPLNVTLAANPSVNQFTGLVYKQPSGFVKYLAKTGVTNTAYSFQVRDTSGALLTTYALTATNFNSTRFKSATLVVRGMIGGTGAAALGVSFIPNY